ncbi:hypothetical protein PGT21_017703 [Puccinia graminis f. sp. tritici]|uniref:Uncharacterized protein n=1 Tax=Puccinia graminis f. sp. tritici TaxID=56615 RepID=A0A5B0LMN3_PUCGR|nr:hypothetical protein PGT21_017703 [Puccinia graminis f. sp. tritici]
MTEDYSSDFPVPNASPAAPSSPEAVSMDLDVVVEAPPSHSIPAPAPISSPRAEVLALEGAPETVVRRAAEVWIQFGFVAVVVALFRLHFVVEVILQVAIGFLLDRGATPPPAPRGSRLPTPQLSPGGPFDRHGSLTSADNSWVEPHVRTRTRVPSPAPFGFYDVDEYHRLAPHQVAALLDRRPDFGRYDQHQFAPQLYTAFYQDVASALVGHFTRHPAANTFEREGRVALFRFIGRRYRSTLRRVPT